MLVRAAPHPERRDRGGALRAPARPPDLADRASRWPNWSSGSRSSTPSGPSRWLIILVDYTEIPALISVSLVYVNDLRKRGASLKPILYLLFLNSQLLHIFWITDEFVVSSGAGETSSLPVWLAYVAILIDYLELPVIYDTVKRLAVTLRAEGLAAAVGRTG